MGKTSAAAAMLAVSLLLSAGAAWGQAGNSGETVTNELDTIIVSADRVPERAREVSQSVTVIGEAEIKKSAANSVADLLKQKGIQVYHDGAEGYGNEGLVVRGGRSSMHGFDIAGDILVLVDGHRSGADSLSQMELGNTARVEVIRGPGAVQYGAAAMGGVVNIITKRGGEETRAGLETGWGSFGEYRAKGYVSGQREQFDYAFGASYFTRDEYNIGGGGGNYENSDLGYRTRYSANLGWNFNEDHRLGLVVSGSDTRDAGKGRDTNASGSTVYNTRQNRGNYNLDLSYEGRTEDQSRAWLARYFMGEVEYDLSRHAITKSNPNAPLLPMSYSSNKYQGSQAQFSWDINRFQFVTGVDWMSYELEQNQTGAGTSDNVKNMANSDFDNIGAFLLAKVHFLEDRSLTLSGGIRYDEFDVAVDSRRIKPAGRKEASMKRDTWTPSVGLAYSPLDFLKLRANYAQAFKMPLPRQLTGYTIMMSTPFIGNPDLQPEENDNWDIGFDVEYAALSLNATYFQNKFRNMIVYEEHTADAHYDAKHYLYLNRDRATVQGLEVGAAFDIGQHFDLNFSLKPYVYWTHLLKFEDDQGWKLPNRTRNTLSYGLSFDKEDIGLSINLDATYYGTQYDITRDTKSGPTYGKIVDDYKIEGVGHATVWDLHLSKRLWQTADYGEISAKVAIKNIFDKAYTTNLENEWMPGSTVYVGLAWDY